MRVVLAVPFPWFWDLSTNPARGAVTATPGCHEGGRDSDAGGRVTVTRGCDKRGCDSHWGEGLRSCTQVSPGTREN
eukprot:8840248-Pyramimonas_sp.AAC.1